MAIAWFGLLAQTQAVAPLPDGCYPGFTTAEGCNALHQLGAGAGNTGVGWYSLFLVGDANYNTGLGAGALALTTTGADSNTALEYGERFFCTSRQHNGRRQHGQRCQCAPT